jgi:hypothetical protein
VDKADNNKNASTESNKKSDRDRRKNSPSPAKNRGGRERGYAASNEIVDSDQMPNLGDSHRDRDREREPERHRDEKRRSSSASRDNNR